MTRVRCPQKRCSFWMNEWCDADEIEIDLSTFTCMTFDELEPEEEVQGAVATAERKDDLELEWLDDESIFEDDLNESLYGVDDGDPELEDDEDDILEEEDPWPK